RWFFGGRSICGESDALGYRAGMARGELPETRGAGCGDRPESKGRAGLAPALWLGLYGNAAFLEEAFQLALLEHLFDDVAAADELAFDIELRNGRPVGEFLDALADFRVFQNIHRLELDAELRQHLHNGRGEAALRKYGRALHVKQHVIFADV